MTVIKIAEGKKDIVGVYTLNGRTFQEMTMLVREVIDVFDIHRVHVGAGGGGLTLKDLLAEKWTNSKGDIMPPILDMEDPAHENKLGIHMLKMVNETARRNSELYMNMKSEMQHNRLRFPVDVNVPKDAPSSSPIGENTAAMRIAYEEILKLKRELLVLQAEPSGMYYKFTVPPKFKKDRATALVMAVDAALDLTRSQDAAPIAPLAIGNWV
jgi:hypothetical protein